MLGDGPCAARVSVPLEQHLLPVEDQNGEHHLVFLISPGEKLCLMGSNSLADLHLHAGPIEAAQQRQALISVELQLLSIGTVLVVKNHFDRPLDYHALIKVSGQEPEPTSICTVKASLAGVEHWPGPVESMAVGDFKLLNENESPGCR